ncbi:MAG: hypothetical protein AAB322_01420 [Pseudomonadota bacterium]
MSASILVAAAPPAEIPPKTFPEKDAGTASTTFAPAAHAGCPAEAPRSEQARTAAVAFFKVIFFIVRSRPIV